MLNMPILKFDKSIKYLDSQISIQKNNKNLILDIISNIGLILNTSSTNDNTKLQSVLDTANNFLQNISSNITTLEQLNLEISNITADLNEIVSAQSKSTKTKEYYITAFGNIKNNITQYTQNFQEVENKLEVDNNEFNDFIKDNDFKYTFNPVNSETEDSENTYELASFSINNESTSISTDIENENIIDDDIIDNGIEEAMTENEENSDQEPIIEDVVPEVEKTIEENTDTSTIDELNNNFEDIITDLYDNNTISEAAFNVALAALKSHITSYNEVEEQPSVEEQPTIETQEVTEVENTDTNSNLNMILNNLFDENKVDTKLSSDTQNSITSIENQNVQVENRPPSIEDMIKKIESAEDKNKILLISEKTNKIYLPYRIAELENYMKYYPKIYKSLTDVVKQEFIIDLDTFLKHPSRARFAETYNLIKNRSGKSVFKALSYALKLKNNRNIDPAIIAACKNEYELRCYLYCLEQNKIGSFKFFNIIYDIHLLEQKSHF